MIVLSPQALSLTKIKTWDDVVGHPGYVPEIDPAVVKLDKIIAEYSLNNKPKCGLKGCATPHIRGYLVVCKNGSVTNIGNICGKREFNVDFDELKASFQRDLNEKTWREEIVEFRNQLDPIEKNIHYLREGERQGNWCFERLQFHAERAYPEDILNALQEKAKRGDGRIIKQERLSKRELDLQSGSGEKSHFKETVIDKINGISAIHDYKKLRRILSVDLGSELDVFKSLDESKISTTDLKRWYKWTKKVNSKIKDVESIIMEAHRFLLPSNIELLQKNKYLLIIR